MMISPEAYYEVNLRGRSPKEIQACIRSLKRRMGELKNRMEDPNVGPEMVLPSAETELYWTREYLALAKKAYAEAGGEVRESAAEKRAARFRTRLPFLKTIRFYIGGYFGGRNMYELAVENDKLRLKGVNLREDTPLMEDKTILRLEEDREIRTGEELRDYLEEIHIEEWIPDYNTERFGYSVCDGTQWEVTFEYSNGARSWRSGGSNCYPWNFNELVILFGEGDPREPMEEEEEELFPVEYLYCRVAPEHGGRSLYYISEIEDIQPEEIVVIPYGSDNRQILGKVVAVECYEEETAPYPPERTKIILRRATEEEISKFKLSNETK